jgi:DnaJ-class molecular chaperone
MSPFKTCPRCGGSGKIKYRPTSVPREEKIDCPDCEGTGKIFEDQFPPDNWEKKVFLEETTTCEYCGGTGQKDGKECPRCHGKTFVARK